MAALKVGDGIGQRQAQPIARGGAAGADTVKATQHLAAFRLGNAGSRICYRRHRRAVHPVQPDDDADAWRVVAQGILEEIAEHLRQQFGIAMDPHITGNLIGERLAAILGDGHVHLVDAAQQVAQRHIAERRESRSRFDLRDPQQRAENRQQLVGILDGPCHCR